MSRQLQCRQANMVVRRIQSSANAAQQQQQQQDRTQASTPRTPAPSPSKENSAPKTVDFGFQTIAESLKSSRVADVFSSVASSYDTMNDLMSLGIHRLWKDHFVRSLNPGNPPITYAAGPPSGWKILDVAGGTGDIAFRMLDHATAVHGDTHTRVTVSDINPAMLAEGRQRSFETPYGNTSRLDFVEADAESMPHIADASLDLYTVAFGIRNFTNKPAALREAFRILKPGGVFACLEFSKVNNPLFDAVYKRWSFSAIPLIGQIVAGDRDSYQYLVESIDKFPSQVQFRDMIVAAGFVVSGKGWEDLTGGIAAIHKGVKPL